MRRTQISGTTSSFNPTYSSQSKGQAEETAKAIKNTAKAIREAAISTREAVKAFTDSGVVTELAESIQAAAKAARDMTQGISDTGREIHESQNAPKVAGAIHQTLSKVKETWANPNDITAQLSRTAPRTTGTPSIATKRKRKSRGKGITKNNKIQSTTTDKTNVQLKSEEL
jgi:hypothetical protein